MITVWLSFIKCGVIHLQSKSFSDLLGVEEKSTVTRMFLRYNGTTIRVNLTITYFNIDEAFVFYSKGKYPSSL